MFAGITATHLSKKNDMTRLSYKELQALIDKHRISYFQVGQYGKTTSRAALIKALLAAGVEHEGLALDEEVAPIVLKSGTIAYMQEQVRLAFGLKQSARVLLTKKSLDRLDDTKGRQWHRCYHPARQVR